MPEVDVGEDGLRPDNYWWTPPRRQAGRPQISKAKKKHRKVMWLTPWALACIAQIAETLGMKDSAVVRKLIQLGVEKYAELGVLPEVDR